MRPHETNSMDAPEPIAGEPSMAPHRSLDVAESVGINTLTPDGPLGERFETRSPTGTWAM
jgi:hypothetical protein